MEREPEKLGFWRKVEAVLDSEAAVKINAVVTLAVIVGLLAYVFVS